VDDPYIYGQIAAANALSDVYAMGGIPRTALAIAAVPKDGPGPDVIKAIFRGGFDKLREAGAALLGGHTVTDTEIKFGYAVTGEIDPSRILTNAAARVGDTLLLTKALGTGIIATAIKHQRASATQVDGAVRSMVRLNRDAADTVQSLPAGAVSACTDITGFGLAGHGSEMAAASGVTLVIETAALPILEGAVFLSAGNLPGGGRTNQVHFAPGVAFEPDVAHPLRLIVFDPQTSGGLLLAADPGMAADLLRQLAARGVPARTIGRVESRKTGGPLVRFI